MVGGWVVYLDYSVSSGPFLRFTMSFEFLSEMFDHSVSELDNILTHLIPYIYHLLEVKRVSSEQNSIFFHKIISNFL